MTPNELRELEQGATDGPWVVETRLHWTVNGADRHVAMVNCGPGGHDGEQDAYFIAASRNAIPLLIDLWEAADKMANPNTSDAETVEALYQYSEALHKLEELK